MNNKGGFSHEVVDGLQLVLVLEAVDAKLTLQVLAARVQHPGLQTHKVVSTPALFAQW